jgi:preprotein translocase subunit SecG
VLLGAVLAAAFVVVLVALRVLQRRRRDEIRSIQHYHERLDTLHVEPHDRGGSVRVVDSMPVPDEHPVPDRPRVDPAAAHLQPWSPTAPAEERQRRHGRTWALGRMQPRTRVDTGTLLVVLVVVAVLVAIALAGYLIQRGRGSTPPPTTTSSTTSTTTAATTSAPTSSAAVAESATRRSAGARSPAHAHARLVLARPTGGVLRGTLDRRTVERSTAQTGSNRAVKWRSCGGASTMRYPPRCEASLPRRSQTSIT